MRMVIGTSSPDEVCKVDIVGRRVGMEGTAGGTGGTTALLGMVAILVGMSPTLGVGTAGCVGNVTSAVADIAEGSSPRSRLFSGDF